MPFEQYLSAEDQAEVRQAIGNVASGTFGQHDVMLKQITLTPGVYGESPTESETEYPLKGLVLDPEAMVMEGLDRSQIDWDLSIMFFRDYLEEEGLLELMQPGDATRNQKWIIDGLEYRPKRIRWSAQFVEDYLLVFVEVERI